VAVRTWLRTTCSDGGQGCAAARKIDFTKMKRGQNTHYLGRGYPAEKPRKGIRKISAAGGTESRLLEKRKKVTCRASVPQNGVSPMHKARAELLW